MVAVNPQSLWNTVVSDVHSGASQSQINKDAGAFETAVQGNSTYNDAYWAANSVQSSVSGGNQTQNQAESALDAAGTKDGLMNSNASTGTAALQTDYDTFATELQNDGSNDAQRATDATNFMNQLQADGVASGSGADMYKAAAMIQTEAKKGDGEGNNSVDQLIMGSAAAKDGLTSRYNGTLLSDATFDNTTGNYDRFTKFAAQTDVKADVANGDALSDTTKGVLGSVVTQGTGSGDTVTDTTKGAEALLATTDPSTLKALGALFAAD